MHCPLPGNGFFLQLVEINGTRESLANITKKIVPMCLCASVV